MAHVELLRNLTLLKKLPSLRLILSSLKNCFGNSICHSEVHIIYSLFSIRIAQLQQCKRKKQQLNVLIVKKFKRNYFRIYLNPIWFLIVTCFYLLCVCHAQQIQKFAMQTAYDYLLLFFIWRICFVIKKCLKPKSCESIVLQIMDINLINIIIYVCASLGGVLLLLCIILASFFVYNLCVKCFGINRVGRQQYVIVPTENTNGQNGQIVLRKFSTEGKNGSLNKFLLT